MHPAARALPSLHSVVLLSLLGATAPFATAAERSYRSTSDTVDPAAATPRGMTFISGGKAIIGIDAKEIQELGTENPQTLTAMTASNPRHEVQIEPFYLDTHEVTNRQWKVFLDATGRKPNDELVKLSWKDGKIPAGAEDLPAVCVSYQEAAAYCRWAGKRLPTEFEWEYAARGTDGRLFPWGNDWDLNKAVMVEHVFKERGPQKVGSCPDGASPFGVLDMAGNVWEWTSSKMEPYPGYEPVKVVTKRDKKGELFKTTFDPQRRVLRGGAFDSDKYVMRCAVREDVDAPVLQYNTVGLRTAKSLRPGADAILNALDGDVGNQFVRNTPIDASQTVAVEVTNFDEAGLNSGVHTVAFAPAGEWERLIDVEKKSVKSPVTAGVLVVTEKLLSPPLEPGTYVVQFQAGDKDAKALGDAEVRGWVHAGNLPARVEKEDAKPRKKAEAEKEGDEKEGETPPAEPPAAEAEPAAEEAPAPAANRGDLAYDRSKSSLLLVDASNSRTCAVLPLEDVRDNAKKAPASLEREEVRADEVRKLPAYERFTFSFVIPIPKNKKAVEFSFPVGVEPGAFAPSG